MQYLSGEFAKLNQNTTQRGITKMLQKCIHNSFNALLENSNVKSKSIKIQIRLDANQIWYKGGTVLSHVDKVLYSIC